MTKQLLILDIDETLAYGAETALDRSPDFEVGPYSVYKRPFLDLFLDKAFEWFEVAVWSSASDLYVQGIVEHVFRDRPALRFAWGRTRCTQSFDGEHLDYFWLKNLKKVKRLGFPLERVLMVDDTPQKVSRQYGNHLRLRPFLGQLEDTELRDVLPFLDHLRSAENLRTVEKRLWRQHGKSGLS